MVAHRRRVKADLLSKLEAFQIDAAGSRLSFQQRLARENRWSLEYTERVIAEYKRFLFLVAVSGQPQTPSDQVDQAWHLHMVYTRSYWQDLCQNVLGFDLHHMPTRGGVMEKNKFRQFYEDTLAHYQQCFGESAPVDIWPSGAERFSAVEDFTRINTRDYWLLPKPKPVMIKGMAAVCLTVFSLVACGDQDTAGGIPLWLKLLVALPGIYLLIKFLRWIADGGRSRGDGGGCAGCGGCGGCGG